MVFTSYHCFCHQFLYETLTDVNLKGVKFFLTLLPFNPWDVYANVTWHLKKNTSKLFFFKLLSKTEQCYYDRALPLQPWLLKTA